MIGKRHILTSGQCIKGLAKRLNNRPVQVYLHNLKTGRNIPAKNITLHASSNKNGTYYDWAVLRFKADLGDNLTAACLSSKPAASYAVGNKAVTAFGYGKFNDLLSTFNISPMKENLTVAKMQR